MKVPKHNIKGEGSGQAQHSDTFCPAAVDGEPEWQEVQLADAFSPGATHLSRRACVNCGHLDES